MVSLTLMYRRPKSLEIILAIRKEMSEEAEYDIPTFVGRLRTDAPASTDRRTVTRVEGSLCDDPQSDAVPETSKVKASDQ